jgi:pimeloyl-ACP methyl ester carboxylesterase
MCSSRRLGPRRVRRHRARLPFAVVLCAVLAALSGCDKETPPEATPAPTLRPTATPSPAGALDGLRFVITLDDRPIATEELHTRLVDGALLAESTLTWIGTDAPVERRSALLSPLLYPTTYSLEREMRGVTSWWVAQRDGGVLNTLSNNLAWYGPVQQVGITPAAGVMLERSPSALPLALLALQFTEGRRVDELTAPYRVPALDVTEDLGVSRQLTLSLSDDQGNAVIGTLALDGSIGSGANRSFVLWMRPDTRLLFRAEFPDYQFGYWERLRDPRLTEPGLLRIERVSALPTQIAPTPALIAEVLTFQGSSGALTGRLYRPEGRASAPAMLVRRGWDQPDFSATIATWTAEGWAVFVLDPAGVGASEGAFQRAPDESAVSDLRLAAGLLASVSGIDSERIILMGLGDSAIVSALALAPGADEDSENSVAPFAGAVLGSFATEAPLLPDLAADRVLSLAAYYGWSQEQIAAYLDASIRQWDTWLADGNGSVSALGRRVSTEPLFVWKQLDLYGALDQTETPVLILQGASDEWTPPDGAARLAVRLVAVGTPITYRTFDGLGHDLGRGPGYLWAEGVDVAVREWIKR